MMPLTKSDAFEKGKPTKGDRTEVEVREMVEFQKI